MKKLLLSLVVALGALSFVSCGGNGGSGSGSVDLSVTYDALPNEDIDLIDFNHYLSLRKELAKEVKQKRDKDFQGRYGSEELAVVGCYKGLFEEPSDGKMYLRYKYGSPSGAQKSVLIGDKKMAEKLKAGLRDNDVIIIVSDANDKAVDSGGKKINNDMLKGLVVLKVMRVEPFYIERYD